MKWFKNILGINQAWWYMYVFSLCTRGRAGGSPRVQGQPGLQSGQDSQNYSETLFQNNHQNNYHQQKNHKNISSLIVCIDCVHAHRLQHTHWGQKETEGVGSFPSTVWVLGTELRLSGWAMLAVSFYNLYNSDNVDYSSGLKKKVTGHRNVPSVLFTLHNKVGIIFKISTNY